MDGYFFIYELILLRRKIIWRAGKNRCRLVDKTQGGIFRFAAARKIDVRNSRLMNIFCLLSIKFIFSLEIMGRIWKIGETQWNFCPRLYFVPFVFKRARQFLDNYFYSFFSFARNKTVLLLFSLSPPDPD